MTSWIYIYTIVVIIPWYIFTGSLMMISLLVFLVIMKNVVISFIKEYRGPTLRPPCDVIDDVIIMKILFWHKLGRSLYIWGQIEAVFNISKFSKWPPSWAWDKLFTESYTRRRIYQKYRHDHFRHFELLIDAVIRILTKIYQFQNLTNFVTWWHHQLDREYSFI